MLRSSFSVLSALARLALIAYIIFGLGFVGLRYLVLPNLGLWNTALSDQVSAAIGARVQFGDVQAQWSGLNPRVQLSDVKLFNQQQQVVLSVPQVHAELSWHSLFSLRPQFVSLRVDDISLDVTRDRQGRVLLLGQSFTPGQTEPLEQGRRSDFIPWLLQQKRIVIRNAQINWHDEQEGGEPFRLEQVTLDLLNSGPSHRLSLVAAPPATAGEQLDLRLELSGVRHHQGNLSLRGSTGKAYVNVQGLRPRGWAAFLPVSQHDVSGRVSATAWFDLVDGMPSQAAAKLSLEGVQWQHSTVTQLSVQSLDAFASGSWSDMQHWFGLQASNSPSKQTQGLDYRVSLGGLRASIPEALRRPIDIDRLFASGKVTGTLQGAIQVRADSLALANSDAQASLAGTWQSTDDSPVGLVDLQGTLHRFSVTAIKDYLPLSADPDAYAWMETGLLQGEILDAGMRLKGDLLHFPFQEQPAKGDFLIRGRYVNTDIDYVPATEDELGWPKLQGMAGEISLHRADLRMSAESAYMQPAPGQRIELGPVYARIPNIESDAVLWVKGQTTAPAAAYLSLMHSSPLGELLDHAASEAIGQGQWQVPLELTIPLYDSMSSKVRGKLVFDDAQLVFMPGVPELTGVTGALEFTESYLKAESLKGRALGGIINIEGGVGEGQKGLSFTGTATSSALRDYAGVPALKRVDGALNYTMTLVRTARGYTLEGTSNLKGLALDFPPPLAKSREQVLPTRVLWERTGTKTRRLRATVGQAWNLVLLQHDDRKKTFFHAGALGFNKTPDLPATGLVVDIEDGSLDLDAWHTVIDEFSIKGAVELPAALPALNHVRIQAQTAEFLGLPFDRLTLTARQEKEEQWRVDISSSETAGTLFWRQPQGKATGRIDAKFDRLSLGKASDEAIVNSSADKASVDQSTGLQDDLEIPAVSLYVRNLTLYGRQVGELTVMGMSQARGQLWRLDELRLASPSAVFTGSGMWRLSGEQRGLTLDMSAEVSDMGAYLNQIGHKDVMAGGAGALSANVQWLNMPWAFSRADLNGSLKFNLAKGRFSSVSSHTARLLELLSLQSVRRLARLELNPAELTRDGFPFDNLGGEITLAKGVMSTRDYRVSGPVATIVLEGAVNLVSETLDLEAVVVPNLDVSGAAVAAGIAINPIVGVGAFLTQWLLQAPLSKAMSAQYHISGPWNEPSIKELASGRQAGQKPPVKPEK